MNKSKLYLMIMVILLVIPFLGCIDEIPEEKQPNTIYVNSFGGYDYENIQDAINASPENYTIFVKSGIYNEKIFINKTVNIVGEDIDNTIIRGNNISDIIFITEEGRANIRGFTILNAGNQNSTDKGAGIYILSNNNTITGNNISKNKYGIYSTYIENNNISKNTFYANSEYGIYFHSGSDNNVIYENIFISNPTGLRIKSSEFNEVTKNLFINNNKGMYFCCSAKYNTVFYNSFHNNSYYNAEDQVGNNDWDNGTIGNYWDDYTGLDIDGDGIGDTIYDEFSHGQDNFPLVADINLN